MWNLLFLIALTSAVISIEHRHLKKAKSAKEYIFFYGFLLTGNVIGILWGFHVHIPSILLILEWIGKPFLFVNVGLLIV